MEKRQHREHLTPLGDVIGLPPGKSTLPPTKSDLIPYECPICRDLYFLHPHREDGKVDYSHVVPCECSQERRRREKLQAMIRMCELPPNTEHMTFESFKVGPGLEEAYAAALALAEDRSTSSWLTLYCDVNRGKTHLLIAACRRQLAQGKPARYAYVPTLLDELRSGYRHEGNSSYENRFDFFKNVPLLALDDLGTEHRTEWVQERLDTIIDHRLMHGLALMVNTNLPVDKLNFRIANRLRRNGKVIFVDAPEFEWREQ